jgi:hypothetical protein
MNNENWKTITSFPNYEVSDYGNVRVKETKYIMKPFTNEAGYSRISISNDICKRKKFYIQRLVANEFLPNPENKQTVNHINNNRQDNKAINLEWSTMVEQINHKYKTNNKFKKRINIKNIWRLDCDTLEKLEKYESTTEAVKWIKQNNLTTSENELNLRQSLINVSNGLAQSAYGYKWKYEDNKVHVFNEEIWKEMSFELIGKKNYFISDFGRVKNCKGKICNLKPNAHGYIKTTINQKSFSVHRLVTLAFIPNIENKEFVNHIDGNKTNNKLTNLEWATCLENNIHKINNGLSNTTKKVIQYDINMNKLNEFISITDASKILNLSTSTITNSCNSKIKHTRKDKFIFRFG